MKLIKIDENVLINPEKISAVIMRQNKKGEKLLFIVVDTQEYSVTIDTMEFLKLLLESGMENLTWQYWAG